MITLPLLYFNFEGICCATSANGELLANLQGKWNQDLMPAWDCDYHLDINLQINYWPAERGIFRIIRMHYLRILENGTPWQDTPKTVRCRGIWFPLSTDI